MADNISLDPGSGFGNPYASATALHAAFRRAAPVSHSLPGGEGELRRARDDYVSGRIEVDEFERRVGDVVFGRWSPTSSMAAVLKEAWSDSRVPVTDEPGAVMVYRPVSDEMRIASSRGLTAAGSVKARLDEIAAKHGLKM